ncbi:hypothetical protein HGRIS_013392 [Hohenbuehelia grisea]|uniref:Major facilitator superfamily (MFS) profile domain-containing protein n=1 Tax=Hohenbuehelia grisea TaxID=104357 RepID=A0ABR3IV97_9AGAR
MSSTFTVYGWLVCLWVLILAFQYGYHISVLNQLQDIITCKNAAETCTGIPMDEPTFSAVTASFTFGGLIGSLASDKLMAKHGRHGAARVSGVCTTAGTALMAFAGSVTLFGLGRTIVGAGSGIGICVAPLYLAEIAPKKIAGGVGVLTQLSIVFGIMITQLLGLLLAAPSTWRLVILVSTALAAVQLFVSPLAPESPAVLAARGRLDVRNQVARALWGDVGAGPSVTSTADDGSQDPLLEDEAEARRQDGAQGAPAVSARQALTAPDLRRALLIVCLSMASQQVSVVGVAVLYYSNAILSKTLPDMGPYLSLGITIVNAIMTFPPIILIEASR